MAIALQQSTKGTTGTSAVSSLVVNFAAPTLAGSCIVGRWITNSTAISGVTDDKSDSYSINVANQSSNTSGVFVALNVAAGAQAITFSVAGGSNQFISASIYEFVGLAGSTALDASSSYQHSGGADPGAQFTTSANGDLIFSFLNVRDNGLGTGGTITQPAGFTLGQTGQNDGAGDHWYDSWFVQPSAGLALNAWSWANTFNLTVQTVAIALRGQTGAITPMVFSGFSH